MIKSICIYWASFVSSLILSKKYEKKIKRLDIKKIKKNSNFWLILCIAPVVFVSTIRYGVGTDYFSYIESYNYVAQNFSISLVFNYYQEPLNVILYYLSYILFHSELAMFFIYSFITMVFIVCGIKNFRNDISIPFALFIFYMTQYHVSYNGIRQMVAVSIIFFSYKYVIDRKFTKYLLYVILAALFHKSAIFMILLYFLCPTTDEMLLKTRNNIFYIGILLTPIIVPAIAKLVPLITSKLGIYQKYVSQKGQENFKFLLYVIPPLILIILYRSKILKENYRYEFFIKLMFLQIPLQYMGYYIAYFDRFSLYVSGAQIILFPFLINSLEIKDDKNILYLSLIFWYLFYYIIMFIILKSNEVYPYTSIFSLMNFKQ